jgi:hypothetical protein
MTGHEREELLQVLAARFGRHMQRHPGVDWGQVRARLEADTQALRALRAMELTGGEPDVVDLGEPWGLVFCDCAEQTPAGRRGLCYDAAARLARRANAPTGSVQEMAAAMGVQLLDEAQYRALQRIGAFDTRTSSWLQTPAEMRGLGGALFGDRRYGQVFVYHNGAESYYAARGFRAWRRV